MYGLWNFLIIDWGVGIWLYFIVFIFFFMIFLLGIISLVLVFENWIDLLIFVVLLYVIYDKKLKFCIFCLEIVYDKFRN